MFGVLEILYLFLAGTGAGLSIVVSFLGLISPKDRISALSISRTSKKVRRRIAVLPPYRTFLAPAMGISGAFLAIGTLCLVFALGRPEKAFEVFASSEFTWANFGSIVLVVCIALAAFQAILLAGYVSAPFWMLRFVGVLTVLVGFSAALYTGMLLYDMTGIPFWHSPFLPVLFVASSISCGFGVLLIVSVAFKAISQFKTLVSSMLNIDFIVIILEAVALVCFLFVRPDMGEGNAAVSTAVETLASGNLCIWFWVFFVGFGVALPLCIELICWIRRPRALESMSVALGAMCSYSFVN